ncbi:MAG: NADH-quinone oxidoreductase subunit NuoF [bacterium]|nr:NADH-quinone oxidoreductase subunit NuoF [bacterium]MDW8105213.1 NADH-quinone oxidoreductase subunit NuoF [Armatimonadota bacterium]
MPERRVLFEHRDVPGIETLEVYEKHGGYSALRKALSMTRQQVIDEVKASGVRGRGGAGFPAWIKWNGIPKDESKPHYVLCNADEGEPGTFKDRELMMRLPHQVIEGMVIAGYATLAKVGYIYIRGEYTEPARVMRRAIDEAYRAGYLGKNILGSGVDFDLYIHMGAGSYECGEESAMMSSLMGERGQPRLKFPHAPLPTIAGLWDCPTLINNVETLSCVPAIIRNGGAWYASMGTEKSTGTKIFSVSGHVNRPGNYEVEMGTPLMELLELAGGVKGKLKAVIPGGSSVPILPADKCDVNLDYESLQAAGTMLGSGGFMVLNDTVCIVRFMRRTAAFYAHESCGKCTPCREGTRWMVKIFDRILAGGGRMEDIDLLLDICDQIDGRSYCGLGDAAAWPIRASIKHFRHEYEYFIQHGHSIVEAEGKAVAV